MSDFQPKVYEKIIDDLMKELSEAEWQVQLFEARVKHLKTVEEELIKNRWGLFNDAEVEVISNWCKLVHKTYVLSDDGEPDYRQAHDTVEKELIAECSKRDFVQFGVKG